VPVLQVGLEFAKHLRDRNYSESLVQGILINNFMTMVSQLFS
jgi:hypothetical protein